MRYIAMALEHLGEMEEAERWFYRAVGEAPYLREPWVNLARFLYQRQDWPGVAYMTHRALQIQTRPGSYINAAEAWGPLPWDLASIALYHLGQYKESARLAQEALRLAPGDARIQENLRLIRARAGEPAEA